MSTQTKICRVCEQRYRSGEYKAHVAAAHPDQSASDAQRNGPSRRSRWTSELAFQMASRVRNGERVVDIADEYGVTDGRIRQVFTRFGVKLSSPAEVTPLPPLLVRLPRKVTARQRLVEKYGDQWSEVIRLQGASKSLVAVASEVESAETSGQ